MLSPNCKKWYFAAISAAIFFVVASPMAFKATAAVASKLGFSSSDDEGCPTMYGLLFHAVVFMIVMRLVLAMKKK